jgi:hypothetical protein
VLVVTGTGDVSDVLVGGTGNRYRSGRRHGRCHARGFNAATASVEAWAGNGAAVLGTNGRPTRSTSAA